MLQEAQKDGESRLIPSQNQGAAGVQGAALPRRATEDVQVQRRG